MEAARIILLSVLAAVLYGVVHDQVTARVCIEYFTIAHTPVLWIDSPTLLGLFWGVVATWWVGLPLGGLLAIGARAGGREKRTARELVRPLARLLLTMGVIALFAGMIGYALACFDLIELGADWRDHIPEAQHERFLFDAYAHRASYASGVVGGGVLAVRTFVGRAKPSVSDRSRECDRCSVP